MEQGIAAEAFAEASVNARIAMKEELKKKGLNDATNEFQE